MRFFCVGTVTLSALERYKSIRVLKKEKYMTKFSKTIAIATLAVTLALPLAVFAQDGGNGNAGGSITGKMHSEGKRMGTKITTNMVSGTVTGISGNTITLTSSASTTPFTVDATNAKLLRKFGASMVITDIQTGDTLQVRGTVSGSSVIATTIRDMSLQAKNGTFSGTISAMNGTSFTLQSKERGSQTINTTSTTVFKKNGQAATLSDLASGQTVTVSGVWDRTNSNVTATKVNIVIKMVSVNIKGTLQSVSGTTLTILGSDSVNYSVDASKAKVTYKNGHKGTVSILQTNDSLQVMGRQVASSTTVTALVVKDLSQTFAKTNLGEGHNDK